MNVADLKGQTIGFLGSGGLDSCTITRWLTDHGVKVVCFTGDLGQPDEKDVREIATRMKAAGAEDFVLVPAQKELAEAGLQVVQSQATYEGRYWNTTGIARFVLIQAALPEMRKRGIKILSHGATGRGNDQVRFQLATNMLAPDFQIYAPWRDDSFLKTFGGRAQMIDFCEARKLPITATRDQPYSTDANLLGLTHEAGVLESLQTSVHAITPGMGVFPKDAPAAPEKFSVRFEAGKPVEVNGKSVSVLEAFLEANKIGGRNGVGIGVHLVENRFVGIKSRGVYEGPGIELLGSCYDNLIQLVLDRRARDMFDHVSRFVSKQIYQGYWFDLGTEMALKSLEPVAKRISGIVTVELLRGTISFISVSEAKHSLYCEETASMEAVGTYNHGDSEGLLRILGVSARALAVNGQVRS